MENLENLVNEEAVVMENNDLETFDTDVVSDEESGTGIGKVIGLVAGGIAVVGTGLALGKKAIDKAKAKKAESQDSPEPKVKKKLRFRLPVYTEAITEEPVVEPTEAPVDAPKTSGKRKSTKKKTQDEVTE